MKKFAKLKYSEIKTKKIDTFKTAFSISPLERGFANTLGNAIRRVLLSSVSGVAPFAIKVKDVEHEFQSIKGIKEDMVQLILNLKKVRFHYNEEVFQDGEIVKLYLKSSEGEVRASDFELSPGVEIVDKNNYIATVSKDGMLELEMYLITGRGYLAFEENKEVIKEFSSKMDTKIKTGSFIAIDSDFSPVVNVSYESVELNNSSSTIQEKLTINVETDGSVDSKDAIAQSAHILMSHLEIISDVSNIDKDEIFSKEIEKQKEKTNESVQLFSLDLSVRSYNCLKRAGFKTLEELSQISTEELVNIKNLGKKSVDEIINKLVEYNITLKGGN